MFITQIIRLSTELYDFPFPIFSRGSGKKESFWFQRGKKRDVNSLKSKPIRALLLSSVDPTHLGV